MKRLLTLMVTTAVALNVYFIPAGALAFVADPTHVLVSCKEKSGEWVFVSVDPSLDIPENSTCAEVLGLANLQKGPCKQVSVVSHRGTNGRSALYTLACEDPVCGNGIVETGEQCDDGETKNGPAGTCTAACEYNCPCNYSAIDVSEFEPVDSINWESSVPLCRLSGVTQADPDPIVSPILDVDAERARRRCAIRRAAPPLTISDTDLSVNV